MGGRSEAKFWTIWTWAKLRLMAHAVDRLLQDIMDIALLGQHVLLTGKIQKIGDDLFASQGFLDDHLQILPTSVFFTCFLIQCICKQQDAPQRVVDLMGDPRGKLSHGSQLFFVEQFLLRPVQGVDHMIEGSAQNVQFSFARCMDPHAHIPLGKTLIRLHQVIDRPGNKSGDRQGDHPGEQNTD